MFSSLRRRKRGCDAPSVLCVSCRCRLFNQSYASLTSTPPPCASCVLCQLLSKEIHARVQSNVLSMVADSRADCGRSISTLSRSTKIQLFSHVQSPSVKPNAIQQPIEHFASRSQEYRRQKGLITFSVTSPFDPSKTCTYSAILHEDGQNSEVHSDNSASIGESLHPFHSLLSTLKTGRHTPHSQIKTPSIHSRGRIIRTCDDLYMELPPGSH